MSNLFCLLLTRFVAYSFHFSPHFTSYLFNLKLDLDKTKSIFLIFEKKNNIRSDVILFPVNIGKEPRTDVFFLRKTSNEFLLLLSVWDKLNKLLYIQICYTVTKINVFARQS